MLQLVYGFGRCKAGNFGIMAAILMVPVIVCPLMNAACRPWMAD